MTLATTIRNAPLLLAVGGVACTATRPPEASVRTPAWATVRQVEVTASAWAAGLHGDSTSGGGVISTSFAEDVLDGDWTGMLTAVVPLGRWSLFADATRVERSSTSDRAFFVDRIAIEQQVYGLSLGYRVVEGVSLDADVFAGARHTQVDTSRYQSEFLVGGIFVPASQVDDEKKWVDAVLGTRLTYCLAEQWALTGHFDAGGGSSNFTTQAIASLDFQLSRTFIVSVGYRHLYTDYEDDEVFVNQSPYTWKMDTAGFFAGFGVRF